jgi:hypothetical protein
MTIKYHIELPPHCYSREYLEQSGIHCEKPVLDTAFRRGPGLGFYFFLSSAILLLVIAYIDSLLSFFQKNISFAFVVLSILFALNAAMLFLRYLNLLRIRNQVRKDPAPITLEPIAIMVIPTKSFVYKANKNSSSIVYKESGTAKPRFFLSAIEFGTPKKLPTQTALLYPHRRISKYYSIDDEYDYVKQGVVARKISSSVLSNI